MNIISKKKYDELRWENNSYVDKLHIEINKLVDQINKNQSEINNLKKNILDKMTNIISRCDVGDENHNLSYYMTSMMTDINNIKLKQDEHIKLCNININIIKKEIIKINKTLYKKTSYFTQIYNYLFSFTNYFTFTNLSDSSYDSDNDSYKSIDFNIDEKIE